MVEETLERFPSRERAAVKEVLEIDQESRAMAQQVLRTRSGSQIYIKLPARISDKA